MFNFLGNNIEMVGEICQKTGRWKISCMKELLLFKHLFALLSFTKFASIHVL